MQCFLLFYIKWLYEDIYWLVCSWFTILCYFQVYSKDIQLYIHVVKVSQFRLTLCNPMDYSWSGSSVHGIFQARILEWVGVPFSRDLPNPGVEPRSPILQADFLPSEPPGKPHYYYCYYYSILISLAWLLPPNAKWQAATKFPLSQRSPRDVLSAINTQWLPGTITLLWQ